MNGMCFFVAFCVNLQNMSLNSDLKLIINMWGIRETELGMFTSENNLTFRQTSPIFRVNIHRSPDTTLDLFLYEPAMSHCAIL